VFQSAADFLESHLLPETACLVADVHMPRMTGVELHGRLTRLHQLTGLGDAKLLKSLECSIKGRHYRA